MKKLTGIVFGLAFVVCALSVQIACAQEQSCTTDADCIEDNLFCNGIELCVQSNPAEQSICESTGDPCEAGETCVEDTEECVAAAGCVSDDDCADDLFCNGDEMCADGACLPGTNPCAASETCVEDNDECIPDAGCEDDDDCADELFCNGDEMCDDGECFSAGDPCADNQQEPFCNEDKNLCVECRTSIDCFNGEICSLNVCVDGSECVLMIKPKKVHINKMFRPAIRRFRIKGGEGFDPRAAIDFGPIDVRSAAVNSKGVLKVLATIPAGKMISKGPVRVSVGECVGEILLK